MAKTITRLSPAAHARLMAARNHQPTIHREDGDSRPRGSFSENLAIGGDGLVFGFTNLVDARDSTERRGREYSSE